MKWKQDSEREAALKSCGSYVWAQTLNGFSVSGDEEGAVGFDGGFIDLSIGVRGLLGVNFMYKSDPVVGIYICDNYSTGSGSSAGYAAGLREKAGRQFRYLGRTELVRNHHNPDFRKYFRIPGHADVNCEIRVDGRYIFIFFCM